MTDKPDPRIEHPDDVVLRVTRAAICGSDLHLFHGPCPTRGWARPSATSSPSHTVKRYLPHLLEHVRAGRLDGRALVTHRRPLERAAHAYELFDRKLDGCVKCVLVPHA